MVVYSTLLSLRFALIGCIAGERMAFLLNKASMLSRQLKYSSSSSTQAQRIENPFLQSQRSYHVELGDREKAKFVASGELAHYGTVYGLLLKEDSSLRRFKSHKKALYRLKRFGDVLTIIVVAGCCYEIYVKATMREEARKQAHEQS